MPIYNCPFKSTRQYTTEGETQYKYKRINCNSERNSVNIASSHIGHEVSEVGQRQMKINFFRINILSYLWQKVDGPGFALGETLLGTRKV